VDVHEFPYLNKGYEIPLQENMVFTIEPSVMVRGDMRIRVEDVVRVTESGGEVFNQVTHEMIVIE
jgi:Xaa-Pro aminopeptidase